MHFKEDSFNTSDHKKLMVSYYEPENTADKVVLIVHGHGEHGERYAGVAEYLTSNGIAVAALTLRGHGKSEGKRGHAPSLSQLILDVEYFIRTVRLRHMDSELFLYGHSMGGNIVLNYLIRDQSSEIKAGIVTSPWIKLAFAPPKVKVWLGNIVADILPSYTEKSDLSTEEISTLSEEVKRYEEDPLIHNKISAKLFQQISRGGEHIMNTHHKINHKVFLAHGELDLITDYTSTEQLAKKGEQFEWHSYPNSKHEIHHDEDKIDLLKDITSWINGH